MTRRSKNREGGSRFAWNERTMEWRQVALYALSRGRTRLEHVLPVLREDPEAIRAAAAGGLISDELKQAILKTDLARYTFRFVGTFDDPVTFDEHPWEFVERASSAEGDAAGVKRARGRKAPSGEPVFFSPAVWTSNSLRDHFLREIMGSSAWRESDYDDGDNVFASLDMTPSWAREEEGFIGPLLYCHGLPALAFAAPELQRDPDILRAVFAESVTENDGRAAEMVNALDSCLRKRSAGLFGPATVPAGQRLLFNNNGLPVHVICLAQEDLESSKSGRKVQSSFLLWATENSDFSEPDIAAVRIRSTLKETGGEQENTIDAFDVRSPYNNTLPYYSQLEFFEQDGDDGDDEFEFEDDEDENEEGDDE